MNLRRSWRIWELLAAMIAGIWLLAAALPACAEASVQPERASQSGQGDPSSQAPAAYATQPVQLPGTPWVISVPANMRYDGPRDGDGSCVFAYLLYYPETEAQDALRMEIDFFVYASEGLSLADAARAMTEAGLEAEIRYVNGIEMLCGVSEDPTDGAPCISYALVSGDSIVEITFWCADQEAANLTQTTMESIREI